MTSPFGTRDNDTRRQTELIALRRALAKSNRRRRIVTSAFGLIVAGAVVVGGVVAMMMFASRTTPSELAGQSLTSSGETQGMSGDMPGMDMYPGPTDIPATRPTPDPHSSDMPGMSGDMPGMSGEDGHSEKAVTNRPLAPVLGTFGGGTSAVMLTAGFLRRRDRAAGAAKQAARAARRAQK